MKRLPKQLLYGTSYTLVLALVIYVFYLFAIFSQPASCFDGRRNQQEEGVDCGGSCAPCGLASVQAIATTTPQVLEIDSDRVSVIAEIRNPNIEFGAESFAYTLNIYNFDGQKIHTEFGESFIYAGEIKNIVEPLIRVPFRSVGSSELLISDIVWLPSIEFEKPVTQVTDVRTEITNIGVKVSGLVTNNSAFSLNNVEIIATTFNRDALRLGISRTKLQRLNSFEQLPFSITVPVKKGATVDSRLTQVSVEARK